MFQECLALFQGISNPKQNREFWSLFHIGNIRHSPTACPWLGQFCFLLGHAGLVKLLLDILDDNTIRNKIRTETFGSIPKLYMCQ